MKVLDWRPWGERWLTSRRRTGAGGPLAPLWARLHDRLMRRRVAARAHPPQGTLVVSVGNLALGGTGKTPVVADLALGLAARGVEGAVVTRGYGSPLAGPIAVDAELDGAGDEARLLAALLAGTPWRVVQSRDRAAGLSRVLSGGAAPAVVILEDGHQTAAVGRHLDILILDTWEVRPGPGGEVVVPRTGAVFPFGPWRESRRGAARASLWLVESATPVPARSPDGTPVLAFRRRGMLRAAGGATTPVARPALVSGIARPERFETEARALLDAAPVLAVRLGDHASYTPRERARVLAEMEEAGADGLVTTAKDWVKLRPHWPAAVPAQVVELDLVWGQETAPADVVGGRL